MAIIANAEWKRVLPENKLARHQDEMRKTLHMHTRENTYIKLLNEKKNWGRSVALWVPLQHIGNYSALSIGTV